MESSTVPAYRRSTFQVALLLVATAGLYLFVWAFHVRRACAALLEIEDQPVWKSIALLIPIFNFFLLFELGKRIEGIAWRARPEESHGGLPGLGIASFFIGTLWRLPGAYFFISLLDFVPLARMHYVFSRAQVALVGEPARPTRFRWVEWIVVVAGCALWALALLGASVATESEPREAGWPFAWIVAVLVVVILVLCARAGRRALAEGLSLHAAAHAELATPSAPTSWSTT